MAELWFPGPFAQMMRQGAKAVSPAFFPQTGGQGVATALLYPSKHWSGRECVAPGRGL